MRRVGALSAIIWTVCLLEPAQAQIDVAAEILVGPAIARGGTAITDLGTLKPFSIDAEFQQTPFIPGTPTTSEEDRLFKHDYTFTIPDIGQVGGGANAVDIPSAPGLEVIAGVPLVDTLQFTMALFTDGGPAGGGVLVDPPGVSQVSNPNTLITLLFSNLSPGAYTLRVAGILGGFDSDNEWHSEYQGNIAITPLPGALALFASALVGLGLVGWRRRSAAST